MRGHLFELGYDYPLRDYTFSPRGRTELVEDDYTLAKDIGVKRGGRLHGHGTD